MFSKFKENPRQRNSYTFVPLQKFVKEHFEKGWNVDES